MSHRLFDDLYTPVAPQSHHNASIQCSRKLSCIFWWSLETFPASRTYNNFYSSSTNNAKSAIWTTDKVSHARRKDCLANERNKRIFWSSCFIQVILKFLRWSILIVRSYKQQTIKAKSPATTLSNPNSKLSDPDVSGSRLVLKIQFESLYSVKLSVLLRYPFCNWFVDCKNLINGNPTISCDNVSGKSSPSLPSMYMLTLFTPFRLNDLNYTQTTLSKMPFVAIPRIFCMVIDQILYRSSLHCLFPSGHWSV